MDRNFKSKIAPEAKTSGWIYLTRTILWNEANTVKLFQGLSICTAITSLQDYEGDKANIARSKQ